METIKSRSTVCSGCFRVSDAISRLMKYVMTGALRALLDIRNTYNYVNRLGNVITDAEGQGSKSCCVNQVTSALLPPSSLEKCILMVSSAQLVSSAHINIRFHCQRLPEYRELNMDKGA